MRLFIAVDVDDETRAQLTPARSAIEGVINEACVTPQITWVNNDAAHVTVRFIGETSEQRLGAIQQHLTSLEIEPFDVTWESLGTFGGLRTPRVLFVAPSSGVEAFKDLAERTNALLHPLLGPGEARSFKPHLTLARIRDAGRGVDWTRAVASFRLAPTTTRVDHVTLYQSQLSPKGPTYTALSTHG
jgi:RNA 2',3'-cyclic 3'-phosphodiesterase